MSLSFRNRLVLFTFVLTGLVSATLILFFLLLYWSDKRLTLIESEVAGVQRSAQGLEELLELSRAYDLTRMNDSRRVALVVDDACNPDSTSPPVVSQLFADRLKALGVDGLAMVNRPELWEACRKPATGSSSKDEIALLPFDIPFDFPAATFLIRPARPEASKGKASAYWPGARLLILSLVGLRGSSDHARLLLDPSGSIAWSDRASTEVSARLERAGIAHAALMRTVDLSLQAGARPFYREAGESALIAAAPIAGQFALVSVSELPTFLGLAGRQIGDAALLAAALLFLSLFLSRTLGYFLIRPLIELRTSAERVGSGDFDFRFTVRGGDEFAGVKKSLNLMIEKVAVLVGESKRKAALESEFKVTRNVQELFFPPPLVQLPDLEMSSFTDTATQCGGDWWGYLDVKAPDGRPLVVVMIGDVTGHGVSSALMTAAVRGGAFVLSRRVESEPDLALDPARMMTLVNRSILDAGQGEMNMTFFIVVIDPRKGKLHCANAAHVQSYLMHPEGSSAGKKIAAIGGKSGITLGDNADASYEIESHDWYAGSKLFLYTDGLTDVVVDEKNLFERKVVRKILATNQDDSPERILSALMAERDLVAKDIPNVDDITVVVCAAANA